MIAIYFNDKQVIIILPRLLFCDVSGELSVTWISFSITVLKPLPGVSTHSGLPVKTDSQLNGLIYKQLSQTHR